MSHKAPGRSDRSGLTVIELFQMFPDEAASRKWLEDLRWPDGKRHCPHCGSVKTATVPNEHPMPYHCGDCREYFSIKTGTVMQSSKVALQKWVIAIYLMSTNLKGVSSMKLHRDLGLTQKSAWLLAQKIRQGWIDGSGKHKAVRLVFKTGANAFWGIEETNFPDAPVLSDTSFRHDLGGREFDLYYSGSKLHMVVLHANGATYWVVNTLLDDLSNETMLAIAKGLKPLTTGK